MSANRACGCQQPGRISFEGDAFEADLVRRVAGGGDQPLDRVLVILEEPPRNGFAFGARLFDVAATDEDRLTGRLVDDVRTDVAVLRRQPARPEVGRLDDVVVHADDRWDLDRSAMVPLDSPL